MRNDKTTLADVQPGGRVRLGDGLRSELLDQAERLERMAAQDRETGESIEQALEAGEEYTPDDAPDVAAGLQHDANRSEEIAALLRKAAAALSAQPSPSKQAVHCPVKHCGMTYARVPSDGRCHACGATVQPSPGGQQSAWILPDDARIVGVIADNIERGKLDHPGFYRNTQLGEVLRRVLSAALAARQPVGEPDFFMVREVGESCWREADEALFDSVKRHRPDDAIALYAAPAQAVDLGQFVPAERSLAYLKVATYHEAIGWNECRRSMLDLIDSQAVGK